MRAFQVKTKEKLEVISGATMIEAMKFYSTKEDIPLEAFQNGTKITEIPEPLWESIISFKDEGEGERFWFTLTELMEDVTEPELITTGKYEIK